VVPRVSSPSGVAGWKELGIPAAASYFNAGVMSIDLALWRRDRVGDRALEYVRRHRDRVYFWDQEGLNAVLAGLWGPLDPRWNHNVSVPAGTTSASRVVRDPWIIHFAGNVKPWRYLVRNSPHELYFQYLDKTPWKGWRPQQTPVASLIGLYERAGIRRIVYPMEMWWMRLMRAVTKRSAGDDLRVLSAVAPAMSYVLITDTFRTISRVVRAPGRADDATGRGDCDRLSVGRLARSR
jgi:hypothetical protein